ncbi:uncharacterized protein BDR25DRAFT_207719 [Lindgomyces ingoldianus]|uniref:Uncharacterized protein n=1 Tax=Lindgomyces ingoldianus TaxID=673940 RepID=A0ACB6RDK5_9PLEO|nr:uncharacterized protein BDR25DRAFT_207719 [Lindgomyces ingoldianus]KAF2477424.1 hypothetical protein BDR25DRAFT_207719 [Lindgomyces ingoldianus]
MPIYHSPTSASRNHSRRSSGRRSFTTAAIPSSPKIESPRTLCPRDGDAFSYDPNHLPAWYIPQDLWNSLPTELKSTLAALQHSGAAVLSGYERLHQHSAKVDTIAHAQTFEDELEVQLDDSVDRLTNLRPTLAKLRTSSNASSRYDSFVSSPVYSSSSSPRSDSPARSMSGSQTSLASPISPVCLTPIDLDPIHPHKRHHDRSFSVPLDPQNAYYTTELSQLRTESIPRLRHAARKVDTEWYESKRLGTVTGDDVVEFEKWYAEKKATIRHLDDQCKRLSFANGVAPTGLGWTAP